MVDSHLLNSSICNDDHLAKQALDELLKTTNPFDDLDSFLAAGFIPILNRPKRVMIAKHPDISGFVFKCLFNNVKYDDSYENCNNKQMINRIIGANVLKKYIDELGFTDFFIVPKKWLYPLKSPNNPFILIAEEMDILDDQTNQLFFRTRMNEEMLKALHQIIQITSFFGGTYIQNIPFTKKGTLAFLDTERVFYSAPHYLLLMSFLSEPMQKLWLFLLKKKNL